MLRTDFKDDVLASGVTNRSYQMTEDSTTHYVSFEDVTVYQVEGDTFGAAEFNATNEAVNKCVEYATGTLLAGETSITIQSGIFFDGGHIEVYVPAGKVQDLVVSNVVVTDGSATITFSSSVDSNSRIDAYCK